MRIYIILGALFCVVAALGGTYLWGRTNGAQAEHASMQIKLDEKQKLLDNLTIVVDDINKTISRQKKKNEEITGFYENAKLAIATLRDNILDSQKEWQDKINRLSDRPECSVLEEKICVAAMDY